MSTSEEALSPRLQEFQREVEDLKVTGGKANPERTWMILGAIGMVVGVVLSLVGWLNTGGSDVQGDWFDFAAMSRFGLTLTVASSALFTVMSLRRWFRFWLVRLIYEMRDQADKAFNSGK